MDLLRNYGDIAKAITETDVVAQRDGIRGQVAGEYQRLYAFCLENMGDDGEGKPDVRYAELGVRVLDRVVKLFRLDSAPVKLPDDAGDEVTSVTTARTMQIVQGQIADLAARNT